MWGASGLTVKLVGSALSVRGVRGQEQGLIVQIAVWGGRFVVRPEFCCAHVAAQGEQRLAQLPCNHRILEGAGNPGGGKWGGKEKKKREKQPLVRKCVSASHQLLSLCLPLSLHAASASYRSLITLPLLLPPPQLPLFIWGWCYPTDAAGCSLARNCYGSRGSTITPSRRKTVMHSSPRPRYYLTCASSSANAKLTAINDEALI